MQEFRPFEPCRSFCSACTGGGGPTCWAVDMCCSTSSPSRRSCFSGIGCWWPCSTRRPGTGAVCGVCSPPWTPPVCRLGFFCCAEGEVSDGDDFIYPAAGTGRRHGPAYPEGCAPCLLPRHIPVSNVVVVIVAAIKAAFVPEIVFTGSVRIAHRVFLCLINVILEIVHIFAENKRQDLDAVSALILKFPLFHISGDLFIDCLGLFGGVGRLPKRLLSRQRNAAGQQAGQSHRPRRSSKQKQPLFRCLSVHLIFSLLWFGGSGKGEPFSAPHDVPQVFPEFFQVPLVQRARKDIPIKAVAPNPCDQLIL